MTDVRIVRVTPKAINEALNGLAPDVRLAKGDGYFYFTSGETANWLDTTVRVPTLSSLTLEQWIDEFKKLKNLNRTILSGKADDRISIEPKSGAPARRRRKRRRSEWKSTIEHYPSGSVIARVLLTANPSVYTPVHESIAHCWREKEMIQPHPLV